MKYFLESVKSDLSIRVSEILGISLGQVDVEDANPKSGADLAVPVFKFASQEKPADQLAGEIAGKIEHSSIVKVEAVSGYVNLWLSPSSLADGIFQDYESARSERRRYGDSRQYGGEEAVVEFTDPNPFKQLHIGHAYSNTVGESLSRLLEAAGAKVHRVTYGGDVGMHVAKAIWGIKKLEYEESQVFGAVPVEDRAAFLGRAYAAGATAFEEDESVKAEIQAINIKIYDQSDPEINQMRETGREWSYNYFNKVYERLGMRFEKHYLESEATPKGIEMVHEGLKQNVFRQSDGAVIFRGEDHGLHTRVFISKEGIPTYEAKDLGLMFLKDADYKYDRSIILTGNEQAEYFKVMLKAAELLQPDLAKKTTHLSHGMVRLSSGKMSSRTGEVVTAEELLDSVEASVKEKNPDAPAIVENALGAFKYTMLKQNIGSDVIYDVDESLDIHGNSGPYIQYAAVRVGSILDKLHDNPEEIGDYNWKAEKELLHRIALYPEAVQNAVKSLEPHIICNFVYELSRELNRFYENVPVKSALPVERAARIKLLKLIQQVFAHSLGLLNVSIPKRM